MKWTVKFPCHVLKQQTAFKKNTQMFMNWDDEDDEEVSV